VALPHPLTVGVQAIEAALSGMAVDSWDGLDETQVKVLVEKLMRVQARIAAHQAAGTRVLDESGLARRSGASSTRPRRRLAPQTQPRRHHRMTPPRTTPDWQHNPRWHT